MEADVLGPRLFFFFFTNIIIQTCL